MYHISIRYMDVYLYDVRLYVSNIVDTKRSTLYLFRALESEKTKKKKKGKNNNSVSIHRFTV